MRNDSILRNYKENTDWLQMAGIRFEIVESVEFNEDESKIIVNGTLFDTELTSAEIQEVLGRTKDFQLNRIAYIIQNDEVKLLPVVGRKKLNAYGIAACYLQLDFKDEVLKMAHENERKAIIAADKQRKQAELDRQFRNKISQYSFRNKQLKMLIKSPYFSRVMAKFNWGNEECTLIDYDVESRTPIVILDTGEIVPAHSVKIIGWKDLVNIYGES